MKIIHISDVHIKNFKSHDEYINIFEQLYKKIKEIKPDLIINTGDTAHTKLSISPAWVEVTANFFKNLADLAPYHVILGNHDLNLKNPTKLDAISPIVSTLNHPNIFFHKNSEVFAINNCKFYVLSLVDEPNWQYPTDNNHINIALFHGSVKGAKTDLGWAMEEGNIDVNVLNKFDYSLLGDIHLSNQSVNELGTARYAGSLVQQNFGELNDKGFLLWDIKSDIDFTCEHIKLPNPSPYISLELDEDGKLPSKLKIPATAKVRLVANSLLTTEKVKRAIDHIKNNYKPEFVVFVNKATKKEDFHTADEVFSSNQSIRDVGAQELLIKDYLKDYKLSEEDLSKIFDINRRYNTLIESNEDIARGTNWSLVYNEWDSLFNYGKGNLIDFSKLQGIVGLLSPNSYGKSSAIANVLFTIFNTTDKNEKKNINIINQKANEARGLVKIDVGDDQYSITRTLKRFDKKVKDAIEEEAKVEVDFRKVNRVSGLEENLNGDSRADTDKRIRKIFGSIDDFLITSMSSQMDSMKFINEGSTKRKEILAKFLDLEIFDTKFKAAKEDCSSIKSLLKKYDVRDFVKEIENGILLLSTNENETQELVIKNKELKIELETLENEKISLLKKNSSISETIININQINDKITSNQLEMKSNIREIQELSLKQEGLTRQIKEKQDFLNNYVVEDLNKQKEERDSILESLKQIRHSVEIEKNDLKEAKEKVSLLDKVPCGDLYPTCRFIKSAHIAKERVEEKNKLIDELRQQISEKQEQEKKFSDVVKRISEISKITNEKNTLENESNILHLKIQNILEKNKNIESSLEKEEEKKQQYETNKEKILLKEQYLERIGEIERKIRNLKPRISEIEKKILELYKQHGAIDEKYKSILKESNEYEEVKKEFSYYELFLRCMHPNGIAYNIIRKKLPQINNEISKILSSIVNYKISFDADDKQLKIFFCEPEGENRPIEMSGGAEKTMAAIAIRLAMLSVSSLPKSDLFILDEPGTALDPENLQGFMSILEMIRMHFKTTLLVSHVDSLKDCADKVISITREDGFAYIMEE